MYGYKWNELQHPKLSCMAFPNIPRYILTNFQWNQCHRPETPTPALLPPCATIHWMDMLSVLHILHRRSHIRFHSWDVTCTSPFVSFLLRSVGQGVNQYLSSAFHHHRPPGATSRPFPPLSDHSRMRLTVLLTEGEIRHYWILRTSLSRKANEILFRNSVNKHEMRLFFCQVALSTNSAVNISDMRLKVIPGPRGALIFGLLWSLAAVMARHCCYAAVQLNLVEH